ncbi:class I SAM-dependent methyltransferase [Candidatus Sumerlaeota bacterium]|nr:class I SAM-dependent methyltransferase [Candidatus Sumerlaeota bacterium]
MNEPRKKAECTICGSPAIRLYDLAGFECVRCTSCFTEALAKPPTVDELIAFYSGRSSRKTKRWEQRMARVDSAFDTYMSDFRQVAGKEKPAAFLDAGGGVGYYAKAARNRGIAATLLDYDELALSFARETLGLDDTVQGDVTACLVVKGPQSFDYILARHVIEHVLSPKQFLQDITALLKPGGYLMVETPNSLTKEQWAHPRQIHLHYQMIRRGNSSMGAGDAIKLACAKSMSGINPPKHLWGFSPQGLRRLLEDAGFTIRKTCCAICGHAAFDPLFYEEQRLGARRGLGIPYYFYERIISPLFAGDGMNLVMLAEFTGRRS